MFAVFFVVFTIKLLNDFEFSLIDFKVEFDMVLISDEIQKSGQ